MPSGKKLPVVDDCAGCGVCCLHMGYPEYIQGNQDQPAEEYWTSMPSDLKANLLSYMASYQKPAGLLDGPCVWFDHDTRQCKHHEHRPRVCRDFRVGSQDCLAWRVQYQDKISPA